MAMSSAISKKKMKHFDRIENRRRFFDLFSKSYYLTDLLSCGLANRTRKRSLKILNLSDEQGFRSVFPDVSVFRWYGGIVTGVFGQKCSS
ncbi:hypothetical protein LEP1GSC193_2870 [Leptospira alstonii serovar Pingchang str. 80-412]|uniref:Uncharacterized protein n=2 Tax=Leptospira alstonii TaxID=28452 RepID=M6D0Z2_9LEPT|nr:hypothetical protein LEP1GSC194_3294 [Leptospira alstonii serovar Sichuan str. 79601]EQA81645.1 hypothetical protein LEP1GSC193_2870 [Leptospira alstonii serovar Pingchang str. 80-412]